jgi:hypothetical protein
MDRTSAQPQVSLSLLRGNSLKFQPQGDIVTIEEIDLETELSKFSIPHIEGAHAHRKIDATINLSVMSWLFRSPVAVEWGIIYFPMVITS